MGVIFRNGIPYGVSQSDVTTVDTVADLSNIDNPKEEHIYVVKAVNQPYRYDSTAEEFYPLSAESPTINANNNVIITGDGNSWAKSNVSSFEIQSTGTDNLIGARDTNKSVIFGTFNTEGQTINLINGFRAKNSSVVDMADNSELYMRDGICIYARYNPETDEPGIEIVNRSNENSMDNNDVSEEPDKVEFTFEELKYLKRFIGTIPSRLANDASGMTEPDTLYFLPVGGGGGGGEELPNATSEDF